MHTLRPRTGYPWLSLPSEQLQVFNINSWMINKAQIDLTDPHAIAQEIEALKRQADKRRKQVIQQYSKKYQIDYGNCSRVNGSFVIFSKGKKNTMTQEQINKFLDIEARLHKVTQDSLLRERQLYRSAFDQLSSTKNKQSASQSSIAPYTKSDTHKKQLSELQKELSAQKKRSTQHQNKWKKERKEFKNKIDQLESQLKLTLQKIESMIHDSICKLRDTFLQEQIQQIKEKKGQGNLQKQIERLLMYLLDQEKIISQRDKRIQKLENQLKTFERVHK